MCASTFACTSPQSFFSSRGLDRRVREEQAQEAHLLERQLERERLRHRGDGGLFSVGFVLAQGATVSVVTWQVTG